MLNKLGVKNTLWDNIRKRKGSGKKPTPEMLEQERKIKGKYPEGIQSIIRKFKRGGTVLIEIEGKKTPEIHTDKNFNIKNLGSIPHSKGGNVVKAKEGDVVFPTQNSKAKFNKVMAAIKNKDTKTLEGIRKQLPA